jgi:Archaea-specific editing domain of threonyl-tRNA synthetase
VKLLLLYTHEYWLRPYEKSVPTAADRSDELAARGAVVALVHVESQDPDNHSKLVTKAIKQIKWLAGKFSTQVVVLHSFAHLAGTRADPADAESLLDAMQARLEGAGYAVQVTPFGYFNEFRMHVAGPSLAKVFVDL